MQVRIYGADWSHGTHEARKQLDDLDLPYDYVNVDLDSQAAVFVREHNHGENTLPTVEIDGRVLCAPGKDELQQALRLRPVIRWKATARADG